jgi:hypothetical protein
MSNISVTINQNVIEVSDDAATVDITSTPQEITVLTGGTLIIEDTAGAVVSVNGFSGPIVVLDTDDIPEGTKKYFSNTLARAAISGSTGVTYNTSTGEISIGQPVATTDSVTFNNVAVTTNLRLNGNKIFNSTNDEFIRLVKDNNGTKFIEFGQPGGYDVSLYPGSVVYKGSVAQTTSSTTLTTTAANQVIDQYDRLGQRASNYVIQIRAGTEYEIWEGMLLHDDVNVFTNAYGEIRTGLNSLATITADISGDYVRLLATPANANTTFRLFKTIFEE